MQPASAPTSTQPRYTVSRSAQHKAEAAPTDIHAYTPAQDAEPSMPMSPDSHHEARDVAQPAHHAADAEAAQSVDAGTVVHAAQLVEVSTAQEQYANTHTSTRRAPHIPRPAQDVDGQHRQRDQPTAQLMRAPSTHHTAARDVRAGPDQYHAREDLAHHHPPRPPLHTMRPGSHVTRPGPLTPHTTQPEMSSSPVPHTAQRLVGRISSAPTLRKSDAADSLKTAAPPAHRQPVDGPNPYSSGDEARGPERCTEPRPPQSTSSTTPCACSTSPCC